MNHPQYYTAPKIFTGQEWLNDHVIEAVDGRIRSIFPRSVAGDRSLTEFPGSTIAPAYIDLQIYGAEGKLLAVYPDVDALRSLAAHCKKGGTSFCLPTVATNEKEVFFKCIDAVRKYRETAGDAIPGIHLEGPWLNPIRRGAHIETLVHAPGISEVREMLEYGRGVIRMITLAPEVCSDEVISLILSEGIIISAGHSNATYTEAMRAFDRGIQAATHLFNAMSPLHHREPGLPGAIFDHQKVMCSVIPDGYHVAHSMIRMAEKCMGERLFAITDAVTETVKGYYPHQRAGDKFEATGILSGSALTMNKAMINLAKVTGLGFEKAHRMCSAIPAKLIGLGQEAGTIAPGYLCKLIVLDENLELKDTLF